MKLILESNRLLLRQFTAADTEFIIRLLNTPGWLKYVGDRNIKTPEQALEYLRNGTFKSYQENGFGMGMVETKDSRKPIGMCGLIKRDTLDHPDIGFALLPEFIGQGYGQEIARATLDYGHQLLNMPHILAIVVAHNQASINVLQKIGMKLQKSFSMPGDAVELLLFSSQYDRG